jgi:4-deoxy-L-threo-5-hexosulose-uronate ketol-isomerase
MTIAVRQACSPAEARHFSTQALRDSFLIEDLFSPGRIAMTYSHIDRMVVGGAMPTHEPLPLLSSKPIGSDPFLARREMGIINIGGPGVIDADGTAHTMAPRDCLYVAMGTAEVSFRSSDPGAPAKFYFISLPAHARHATRKIGVDEANHVALGDPAQSNVRTIHQYIHPDICRSCQLVMGMTVLETGSIWNTMPCHTHDRRSEAYLYFALEPAARVFHFMGEPQETRHLVVANEQAVVSPGWSIHCGAGTSSYSFIWAMGGDNQDFGDMDMVAMETLR